MLQVYSKAIQLYVHTYTYVNAILCARCMVRPNKLKRRSLEQRKVYFKAMQGDEVAHALKSLELSEGFRQSIFKDRESGGGRVRDQLAHNFLIS